MFTVKGLVGCKTDCWHVCVRVYFYSTCVCMCLCVWVHIYCISVCERARACVCVRAYSRLSLLSTSLSSPECKQRRDYYQNSREHLKQWTTYFISSCTVSVTASNSQNRFLFPHSGFLVLHFPYCPIRNFYLMWLQHPLCLTKLFYCHRTVLKCVLRFCSAVMFSIALSDCDVASNKVFLTHLSIDF